MATVRAKSAIEMTVDRMFNGINYAPGKNCTNPVTGGRFVWGEDPSAPQKRAAIRALLARQQFAHDGPSDAPPLPLSSDDVEDYRMARGLTGVIGFYARSVLMRDYDINNHPPFYDFACGLMASHTGLWGIENDEQLKRRFPPRPLPGMKPGAYWKPLEEHEKT